MAPSPPRVQFDREKFKEVVLYICKHCPTEDLGAVKLHKALYFSDMLYFVFHGLPITGSTYRKRQFGPTSDDLQRTLREMVRAGDLKVEQVDFYGYRKNTFVALREPDSARLNDSEQGLLDNVIDFVCRNTAKTISDFSHNRAWERAQYGEVLPYHSAFDLLPLQVSEDGKQWAAEELATIEAERSSGRILGRSSFGDFRNRIREARGSTS